MRTFVSKSFVAVALLSGAAIVTPAYAATGTGDATVQILQAITVTKASDLNFGKVVAASSASTVTVGENDARTCGAALTCYGATTAGAFNVTGAAGETVTVAIDSPTISLTDGGSNTIAATVSTTTSSLVLTGGNGNFKVAGLLNVGANQAGGTYAGQYTVSVNYQ
jgi:hypothetical protein